MIWNQMDPPVQTFRMHHNRIHQPKTRQLLTQLTRYRIGMEWSHMEGETRPFPKEDLCLATGTRLQEAVALWGKVKLETSEGGEKLPLKKVAATGKEGEDSVGETEKAFPVAATANACAVFWQMGGHFFRRNTQTGDQAKRSDASTKPLLYGSPAGQVRDP